MADLSLELTLTDTWQEVTQAQGLTVGESYVLDVADPEQGKTVWSATTDDPSTAPTVNGHRWNPHAWAGDQRQMQCKAGKYIWMRCSGGSCTVAITNI